MAAVTSCANALLSCVTEAVFTLRAYVAYVLVSRAVERN